MEQMTLRKIFIKPTGVFLGVEDHTPSYEATIFPNPTSEVLNIRTSTYGNVTYSFYDGQVRLVLQDKLSAEQAQIPVSQLATH